MKTHAVRLEGQAGPRIRAILREIIILSSEILWFSAKPCTVRVCSHHSRDVEFRHLGLDKTLGD